MFYRTKTSLLCSDVCECVLPFMTYFVGFAFYIILEMWASAQRDGRHAEYRWRPLFNAAKFG